MANKIKTSQPDAHNHYWRGNDKIAALAESISICRKGSKTHISSLSGTEAGMVILLVQKHARLTVDLTVTGGIIRCSVWTREEPSSVIPDEMVFGPTEDFRKLGDALKAFDKLVKFGKPPQPTTATDTVS